MNTRVFSPQDLQRDATPTTATCTKCDRNIYVPQPEHVPDALKGLSEKAVRALRPLDVDTGSQVRAVGGYRVHDAMMKFQWAALPVKTKVKQLEDDADRAAAKAALRYLEGCEESDYSVFLKRHTAFLARQKKGKLSMADVKSLLASSSS